MSLDTVERFLAGSFDERLRLVRAGEHPAELQQHLGADRYAAYRALADEVDEDHLAGGPPPNLVLVPGLTGSLLRSNGLGGMWWIDARSRRHLKDLKLAPDGLTDADSDAQVEACAVDCVYDPFFAAVYRTDDLRHQGYWYDWRKSLTVGAQGLREHIGAMSAANRGRPVHVVAHSMGGLLTRVALMRHPELWAQVGNVVFLGTPHYGSPAIAGYLKDHLWGWEMLAVVGRYLDRAAFRSLWGVIGLLPAPAGVYPGTRNGQPHPCADFDLYDAGQWRLGLSTQETQHLQTVLDAARRLHEELHEWHIRLPQELRDRLAVIAGTGYRTLFQLAYHEGSSFGWREMTRTTGREPGNRNREGDGRVPLASAELEYVGQTRYVRAEHGRLPVTPSVYTDAFEFLRRKPMRLPKFPEAALEYHLGDGQTAAEGEDPGYLDLDPVPESRLTALEALLEEERLPEFGRVHLL